MTFFSGKSMYQLLDKTVNRVLPGILDQWRKKMEEGKTVDLRRELINAFQTMVTIFLFGKDISQDKMEIYLTEPDGTLVKKDKDFFNALEAAITLGTTVFPLKMIIGDLQLTEPVKASTQNWKTYHEFVLKVVKE